MSRWEGSAGNSGAQTWPGTHILLGSVPAEDFPDHDIHMDICWKKVTNDVCSQPLRGHRTTYTECCCQDGEAWSQQCALCPPRSSGERVPAGLGVALGEREEESNQEAVALLSILAVRELSGIPHVLLSVQPVSQFVKLSLAGAEAQPHFCFLPDRGLCSAVQCGSD